jgi:hypothetical protein
MPQNETQTRSFGYGQYPARSSKKVRTAVGRQIYLAGHIGHAQKHRLERCRLAGKGKTKTRRVEPTGFRSAPAARTEGKTMGQEHLDDLKKARSALVEARRTWVRILAKPGAKDDNAAMTMTSYQEAIEAIDRAIEDEKRLKGY